MWSSCNWRATRVNVVSRGMFGHCFTVGWPSYFWVLLKDGVITGHVVGLDKHWTDRRHVRSDTFGTKICGRVEELLVFHIHEQSKMLQEIGSNDKYQLVSTPRAKIESY